ncbi:MULTISPECIES: FKBP-type peptidyl-prolyl cis-trans isomerase [unclassified Moraxella]|uniref:FKBP-type peptidyl-prolyl cis-trans isomerase n=1 Tax=unclassified Moraxella TaxID=2685852 RepID=UPI003AF9A663
MNTTDNTIINPNEQTRITHGSQVDLHFEVSLENGTVIDSTFDRPTPVSLTIGDGSLLEGFEKVLINLTAGDTRTAHLSPDEAFGQHNPDNIQSFSHAQFAVTGSVPEVGTMMEFSDKGQNAVVGVISDVNDEVVKVDFNHPLAGQNVLFKVQIVKVTPKDSQAVKLV